MSFDSQSYDFAVRLLAQDTMRETSFRCGPKLSRMVRKKGLEPLQPFGYRLLRPARLPVPPLSRAD